MRLLLAAVATVSLAACHDVAVPTHATPQAAAEPGEVDPWAGVEKAMRIDSANAVHDSRSAPPIGELIGRLEARAAAEPDDLGHWQLLAQSYAHMGRDADAARAAGRAIALGADETQLAELIRQAGSGGGR